MINEEIRELKSRFYNFNDAIIRGIFVKFQSSFADKSIDIILSSRDKITSVDDEWVNVNFQMTGVARFSFNENEKENYQVLSNGIHILKIDEYVYFDFGHFVDPPIYVDDFKESKFSLVCESFSYKVTEYREQLK